MMRPIGRHSKIAGGRFARRVVMTGQRLQAHGEIVIVGALAFLWHSMACNQLRLILAEKPCIM